MLQGNKSSQSGEWYSRQHVFSFLYYFQTLRMKQIPSIIVFFYLTNAFIHILIFLSLPKISLIKIDTLMGTFFLFFTLVVPYALIAFQILLFLISRIQLYLLIQMQILAFILTPLLLLSTLTLGHSQQIALFISILLSVIFNLASKVLTDSLLYEKYRIHSLQCSGSYIVTHLKVYQLILITVRFTSNHELRLIQDMLLLAISLRIFYLHFRTVEVETLEFKTLNTVNNLHISFAIILLAIQLLGANNNLNLFIVSVISGFVYFTMGVFWRNSTKETNFGNAFLFQAGYQELLKVSDHLLGLLQNKDNNKQTVLFNFLFSIISEHNKACSQPSCQLGTHRALEELRVRSSTNISQLAQRVLKKIDQLFKVHHDQNPDNLQILFTYIKFMAYGLRNRNKLHLLLRKAYNQDCGLEKEYELFRYKKIWSDIEVNQTVDEVSMDEEVLHFENDMMNMLLLAQELWVQFYEERVDLRKIMTISSKIFPIRLKLQKLYRERLRIFKYSSYRVISLYCAYLRIILRQDQEAMKVEDYMQLMSDRLKNSKQIQNYTNLEQGLIAISLSDTKLGNIFLINLTACDLFKYSKANIIGCNISTLMPESIGNKHDAILTDFLSKRRKTFNTDQRPLFGKDSYGLLFPLQLQLQRASFSANDEFIFIATVRVQKLKKSPLYCLVDNDGEIKEHTTGFKGLFFGKTSKDYKKNIQEIIPTYYEDMENSTSQPTIIQFGMIHFRLGKVLTTFSISSLAVKGENLGFLVNMTYKAIQDRVQKVMKVPITHQLIEWQKQDKLISHVTTFNCQKNCFQMQRQQCIPSINKTITLNQLLAGEQNTTLVKNYKQKQFGLGIKTLRLSKNIIQYIEEPESFHSELESNSQKKDIHISIQNMQQKASKGKTIEFNPFFLAINILFVICIIFLVLISHIYQSQSQEETKFLKDFRYWKYVQNTLPKYAIYSSLFNSSINQTYFLNKITSFEPQFVTDLSLSLLDQVQKQQILKLISTRTQSYITSSVQLNLTVSLTDNDNDITVLLNIYWILILCLGVVILLLMYGTLKNFNKTIINVYTVFLSLREPAIRRLEQACKKLYSRLNRQKNHLSEQQLSSDKTNQDDDNQIQKVKSFRVTSRTQDRVYFIRMALPLIVILVYSIIIMSITAEEFNSYKTLKKQHQSYFQAIPSISNQFMKNVIRIVYNQSISGNNNFSLYSQQIERNLIKFQQQSRTYNFQSVLYGDICSNQDFMSANLSVSCQQIENGLLTQGVASALNYLSSQFSQISVQTTPKIDHLITLIELEYTFLNPVMITLATKTEQCLLDKINAYSKLSSQLAILGIILIILLDIYLFLSPLRDMQKEIGHTNGMVALMPRDSDSPHAIASTYP